MYLRKNIILCYYIINMYFTIGIDALSNPQIHKLLSGGSVRVKKGRHHNVHLSGEQVKKKESQKY
jgi:hypothetical protein